MADTPVTIAVLGARSSEMRPIVAIFYVLMAMFVFSSQDTMSKLLVVDYSPFEIAWFRYGINLVLVSPFLLRTRGRALASKMPWLQLARGAAVAGSAVVFMAGLGRLPLADATAINFVSPLVVTALSIPLLGEKVGPRRWTAVLIGFAGVLIIARPDSATFDIGAVFPMISATLWSIGLILTRRIKGGESALTTLTYSTLVGFIALTILLPFVWQPPTLRAAALLLAIGVVSVVGQYLVILAYRSRPASVLAPLSYTQMIWSTLFGAIIFGAIPGLSTWIGGAIVVISGLYVLRRERVVRARNA